MKILKSLILVVLTLVPGRAAMADLYRWIGQDGTVHISSTLPSNLNGAIRITKLCDFSGAPKDLAPATTKNGSSEKSAKAEIPALVPPPEYPPAKTKIELYTTKTCPACQKVRDWLRSRNVQFTEYDVQNDRNAESRLHQLNPNNSVPTALINGSTVITGFLEDEYSRALSGAQKQTEQQPGGEDPFGLIRKTIKEVVPNYSPQNIKDFTGKL